MGLVTALSPRIGYALASEIAREAVAQNKTLGEIIEKKGFFRGKNWMKSLTLQKIRVFKPRDEVVHKPCRLRSPLRGPYFSILGSSPMDERLATEK
jgi:hypothetical protein